MRDYVISHRGEQVRRISLPDNEDIELQLDAGETAEEISLGEPRPGSVLQP